jgi:hypothetical protein
MSHLIPAYGDQLIDLMAAPVMAEGAIWVRLAILRFSTRY